MSNKNYYPQKRKNQYAPKTYRNNNSIVNPNVFNHKIRHNKGLQNQYLSAFRKTETYHKDKTVIVTERVDVVEFNNDSFEIEFGGKNFNKTNYHRRKR